MDIQNIVIISSYDTFRRHKHTQIHKLIGNDSSLCHRCHPFQICVTNVFAAQFSIRRESSIQNSTTKFYVHRQKSHQFLLLASINPENWSHTRRKKQQKQNLNNNMFYACWIFLQVMFDQKLIASEMGQPENYWPINRMRETLEDTWKIHGRKKS